MHPNLPTSCGPLETWRTRVRGRRRQQLPSWRRRSNAVPCLDTHETTFTFTCGFPVTARRTSWPIPKLLVMKEDKRKQKILMVLGYAFFGRLCVALARSSAPRPPVSTPTGSPCQHNTVAPCASRLRPHQSLALVRFVVGALLRRSSRTCLRD